MMHSKCGLRQPVASLVQLCGACFGIAVLFALLGNPETANADIKVTDPGKQQKSKTIKCGDQEGTLSVSTGVQFAQTFKTKLAPQVELETITRFGNAISLAYKGPNCSRCKWLQFVWRTVQVTFKSGKQQYAPGKLPTKYGHLPLTTDPKNPDYGVDSIVKDSPYYGEQGTNSTIEDGSNTIFDQPGDAFPPNYKEDPRITEMVSIAHFDAFLVCDGKICAKISWTVTYSWKPGPGGGTTSEPSYDVSEPEVPGTLNDAEKAAFTAGYPTEALPK
jgi:hypothetical protein